MLMTMINYDEEEEDEEEDAFIAALPALRYSYNEIHSYYNNSIEL